MEVGEVMAQDRPTAAELVQAVREYLEHDVMAATSGRVQFHARVAANALGIVERELTNGQGLADTERERAAELLGHDDDVRLLERDRGNAECPGAQSRCARQQEHDQPGRARQCAFRSGG